MALLGTPLLLLLLVFAVAMPVGVLLAWPRVRGPRAARVAERVGLILVAQFTALLVGLVALNDYGQFFTSWSDLLGTAPAAHIVTEQHFGAEAPTRTRVVHARPASHTHVVTAGSTTLPSGVTATSWSRPSAWSTKGAVVSTPLTGRASGLTERSLVYLPPAYFTGLRAMPIVEVLSGYPGSPQLLVDRLHYPSTLLGEMRNGLQPMVLVMLQPSVTYPRDTECTNVPRGPQAFTYFAEDVPASVARVLALRPTSFGAIGDSTGAMCAVKLAVMDPQRFTAAVSLSGYFDAITDFTTGDLYGGSATTRNMNDIMWRLQHLPLPAVSLLVATSLTEKGADGHGAAQKLLALVRAPMSADELVLSRGGHNFQTWTREIPSALRWFGWHLTA